MCYFRKDIKEGIEHIPGLKWSEDRLWIKLNAEFFGLDKDMYLCLAYVSPETSCHLASRDNLWNLLEDEIANYSSLGYIVLTGDFNARTSSLLDYIANDSDQHIPLPPDYEIDTPVPRHSEDNVVNHYGKELLEVCIAGQLRIVNGRVQPDNSIGAYTCHTPRGNSVVDYVITSANYLNEVKLFEVGEISPYSDHCPLIFQLSTNPGSIFGINKLSQQAGSLLQDVLEREVPQQDDTCTSTQHPKEQDNPPLIKVTEQNLVEAFANQEFIEKLKILESELLNYPATECVHRFTLLLQETLQDKSEKKRRSSQNSKFPHNSWFDQDCKTAKKRFKKSAKQLKNDPNNDVLRQCFWSERRAYKALIRKKKRETIALLHTELKEFKSNNPREFWRLIDRLTNHSNKEEIPIPVEELGDYFKSLLDDNTENTHTNPQDHTDTVPILDEPIDELEVRAALKGLKKNKAPGLDGLPPLVFKMFHSQLIRFTTALFNKLLEQESYPEVWSSGSIKPIPKKGDKKCASNYRGITLLPIMGKLFTAVLRDRLLYWAELNDKLCESQFGFRQGRRTTDALFVITTAIQSYKKKKKPLFTCFVDFAKAFDSVNHKLLWEKLAYMGVSSKMINILQSMYGKATSRVAVNNKLSSPFPCLKGVRQGCNLSPLLFSLFISDLESHLSANTAGSIRLANRNVQLLLFADDLALLADSHKGLQDSINILSEFCQTWKLNINIDKTKVVVFNRKQQVHQAPLILDDMQLEYVTSYKYLGIILSSNGSFKPAISTLANQASKALFSLIRAATKLSFPDPSLLCYLFDSLVKPVLEYGNEIWGCYPAEELEIVHRRFCKFALGVPRTATNLACYGELGRTPLLVKRKVALIKYWLRVATDWDTPDLVKDAYILATSESLHWANFVKTILSDAGFPQVWIQPSSVEPKEFIAKLDQRLTDHYVQSWQGDLRDTSGKLRTYKTIKENFNREAYLTLPPFLRVPLTRLRTSTHPLRIETGRYNLPAPLSVEERVCWFCTDQQTVEDELHFLFDCGLYTQERQEFIEYCKLMNKAFSFLTNIDKWKFISNTNNKQLMYLYSKFVSAAFEKRRSQL